MPETQQPTIKKTFVNLHSFLVANKDKKVSEILTGAEALMSSSSRGQGPAALRDADGNVVAQRDMVTKRICVVAGSHAKIPAVNSEDLKIFIFGVKAGTSTGLNSMHKVSCSWWTANNTARRKEHGEIFGRIAKGEVKATDGPAEQVRIDKVYADKVEAYAVERTQAGEGFADFEEAQAYLKKLGVKF